MAGQLLPAQGAGGNPRIQGPPRRPSTRGGSPGRQLFPAWDDSAGPSGFVHSGLISGGVFMTPLLPPLPTPVKSPDWGPSRIGQDGTLRRTGAGVPRETPAWDLPRSRARWNLVFRDGVTGWYGTSAPTVGGVHPLAPRRLYRIVQMYKTERQHVDPSIRRAMHVLCLPCCCIRYAHSTVA